MWFVVCSMVGFVWDVFGWLIIVLLVFYLFIYLFIFFILRRMGKNKALAHHTSTYFHCSYFRMNGVCVVDCLQGLFLWCFFFAWLIFAWLIAHG